MMAITVKMMKLVRKIPWNSFASASDNPDIEVFTGSTAMRLLSGNGLAAFVAPIPRDWDCRDETGHGACSARGHRAESLAGKTAAV
jgi:hypothetical protein